MDDFVYFDSHHAINIHNKIINYSGGILGVLNVGLLESILDHIQNDVYYPNIEDKLTHLFYSINKGHCFADGNKRASILLSADSLAINEREDVCSIFILRMENIAVYVAENRIDKDLLFEIIYSILYEIDYSEELKLKIYHELSK
jgi:death-on-curing protein